VTGCRVEEGGGARQVCDTKTSRGAAFWPGRRTAIPALKLLLVRVGARTRFGASTGGLHGNDRAPSANIAARPDSSFRATVSEGWRRPVVEIAGRSTLIQPIARGGLSRSSPPRMKTKKPAP
jgi:hypothetical protein